MTGFQIILLARETVCQRLSKDLRLQFIKDLGEVFFRYEDRNEDQLELPIEYPKFSVPKSQTLSIELTLEDLDL